MLWDFGNPVIVLEVQHVSNKPGKDIKSHRVMVAIISLSLHA